MANIRLTIFTPAYNRANTLPRLYESLKKQTCTDFEWLVINDGSSDSTDELFEKWLAEENDFPIRYYKTENGGKNRAVNKGVQLAEGKYFFIVDSDDLLLPNAVSFILDSFTNLPQDSSFIGLSTIRGDLEGKPLNGESLIDENIGYVDCTNLERAKYNLTADMAEVFFTEKLKKYPFPVWKNEKFTPEAVVWDQLALDGYKLRWYNKIIYLCEYQTDGLSGSSWRLLRDNPMGYAMMWNHRLLHYKRLKDRVNAVIQYSVCCILAQERKEIIKCKSLFVAIVFLPASIILANRRKRQIIKLV